MVLILKILTMLIDASISIFFKTTFIESLGVRDPPLNFLFPKET